MTEDRRMLALQAARCAYQQRQLAGISIDTALCVYDIAEKAGLDVRFADLPSMEGIYYPTKPAIVVSSLRPQGRQSFTCAHELGHHLHGDGEQFDELVGDRGSSRRYDLKEFQADCFAGALLMPKLAVLTGMSDRSFRASCLQPQEIYRIASWLGVGYTTLVNHMGRVLGIISEQQVATLASVRLPAIRKSLLGFDCKQHLIVADEAWRGRPIDAQEADVIIFPAGAEAEGAVLELMHKDQRACIFRASKPGIGRVFHSSGSWAHFTRVSRAKFCGMARFRHLKEVDDE